MVCHSTGASFVSKMVMLAWWIGKGGGTFALISLVNLSTSLCHL